MSRGQKRLCQSSGIPKDKDRFRKEYTNVALNKKVFPEERREPFNFKCHLAEPGF